MLVITIYFEFQYYLKSTTITEKRFEVKVMKTQYIQVQVSHLYLLLDMYVVLTDIS
ncbi:hypothetical protein BSNN_33410 [Bacillus subtilis subsp. natto]|nr:hypothetical protein BSNN_33410 [Bacillus subtilis subsp. natto]